MKVWITKYALSSGIQEMDAEDCGDRFPGMIVVSKPQRQTFHGEGKEWHRTEQAAKTRAAVMRHDKINSLQKQIAKLEKLTF